MGVYLSKPIKDKLSSDYENIHLKCGASSMQGWRVSQEDAHNCCLDFDDGISLFAVYDGHGGHEVAEYAANRLPEFIKKTSTYKECNYEQSLKDAFLGFDETLRTEAVVDELKKIAARNREVSSETVAEGEEDCDEGADNIEKLKEEAIMPISDVVAQYTGIAKTPALRRVGETSKPISPFLKAKPSLLNIPGNCESAVSDNEVSSSNDGAKNLVNGLSEKNGEKEEGECSTSKEPTSHDESIPSSSQNGEVDIKEADPEEGGSGDSSTPVKRGETRIAKKRAKASLVSSLLEDNSEESDSEDDESFQISETAASSDEDDENGEGEDEEAEEEEEEEEDEDDADDEDSEEDFDEFEESKDTEEPGRDSGCTAVVAIVKHDEVFVANAGDSRAVLCRNGSAIDMSVDHKPEDGPEMERITNAGGRVTNDGRVNGGLNLSRALGDHTYKQVATLDATEQMIIALPDVRKECLDPSKDEFLVLACDGIWNSMTSQEVVDFVRPLLSEGEKLSVICEKLFDHCLAPDTLGDGTGCDNMTCVIVQFLNSKENGDKNGKRCASPLGENDSKKFKGEMEVA